MCDELTPQQRLANIVAEETDGGRRVVRFFMQVAEGELDHQDFKPNHRMDAAKELVRVGLTEFDDYIRANRVTSARRASKARRPAPGPEMEQARQELAQYARELTDGGRSVIRLYADVMDGLREDEGFKPHHRIAAGRELLKRGFDYECDHTQTEIGSDLMPADMSVHSSNSTNHDYSEPTTENCELTTDDCETDEPTDYLAIVKRVVESLGPTEEEEEDPGYTPDYSMWDMIEYPPLSEISDEHARIGYELFLEAVERDRAWKKANGITPTRKDHDNYDDG